VVLTVELLGWDAVGYATTDALLGSGTARRTLAREIADAVVARGADGVNIDLEPLPSGRRNEFTTWMREIRAALDTKARGYQLVFDALGNFSAWDIAGATGRGAADAVLAMAYTYRGVRTSNAGSTAPFRASGYDVRDTIDAYLAVIPGSKLIVGNPLFSYRYPTQSGDAHAATTGAGRATRYSTAMGYAARYGLLWDDKEQSGWVRWQERACSTCPLQWWQLFFDDLRTQRLKYDYLKARGARGVGLWALGFEGSRTDVALELERAFRPGG
jgi:spore germination protein YaaH